jgi:hypothetical protein
MGVGKMDLDKYGEGEWWAKKSGYECGQERAHPYPPQRQVYINLSKI